MSGEEKLLFAAKIIVKDMDDLARHQSDAPVFYGMGLALMRVYCCLRGVDFRDIPKLTPKAVMQWIREQNIPGVTDGMTSEEVIKKVRLN